jgi:hypothetical protein
MHKIALLLLGLAWLSGCSAPRYGLPACTAPPDVDAGSDYAVCFAGYLVRTDAGSAAAQELGSFMERAANLWTPLIESAAPDLPPLEIRLYRTTKDLSNLLASLKLSPQATGLYLPGPSPAIHVACLGDEPGHPYRTLLHEGTHQFLHLAAGCREPGGNPDNLPRLALPLWINEGLASYFEGAFVTPDLLLSGRADAVRLAQLKRALQGHTAPPLERILTRRYGEPFESTDYAAAWGIVYVLMQEEPPDWADGGRKWIVDRIRKSSEGCIKQPLARESGGDGWWDAVTEGTRLDFEAYVAARGLTLSSWEAAWKEWILSLP